MDTTHDPLCGRYCDGKPPKCRGGDCTLCDEVDCTCDLIRQAEQRGRDESRLSSAKSVRRIRVDERKKVLDYLRTHNRSETIDYLVGL